MPTYSFEVEGGALRTTTTSEEFPNDDAAWRAATIFAGEIFKDLDGKLRPGDRWEVNVADQDQAPLFLINIITRKLK